MSRLTGFGRAALQAISALDAGRTVPAPSPYLDYDKKVVPAWAIRLLVLALILPAVAATVDGFARARRRGHPVAGWIVWVIARAAPFAIGFGFLVTVRVTGLLNAAPPGAVGAGAVPLRAGGAAILVALASVLVLSFWLLGRALVPFGVRSSAAGEGAGAAAAVLLVLCSVALAMWATNPFAAAMIVPALNLWMWAVAPGVAIRLPVRLGLLVVGVAPLVALGAYYALAFGLGPLGLLWTGTLAVAGGQVGVVAAIQWSVVLGCAAAAATIVRRAARERPQDLPVTVRGPVTYAGPGSLGGTESALRR
jgi:hypothetical protein